VLDSELLAFAEQFTVEYMTQTAGEEQDYHTRLSRFAVNAVADIANTRLIDGSSTTATHVSAYRMTEYSPTQYDVYVTALVTYNRRGERVEATDSAPAHFPTITDTRQITLRVPIAYHQNRYVIEGLPAFVSDEIKLHEYVPVAITADEVHKDKARDALTFLTDFFGAYYGESQSVIDVFLSADADRAAFQGLSGVLTFITVDDTSKVYYPDNLDKSRLLALVTLTATDINGNTVRQNYSVSLIEQDGRFFVERLDTRINNLNYGG
jgi:hypothetical protein